MEDLKSSRFGFFTGMVPAEVASDGLSHVAHTKTRYGRHYDKNHQSQPVDLNSQLDYLLAFDIPSLISHSNGQAVESAPDWFVRHGGYLLW